MGKTREGKAESKLLFERGITNASHVARQTGLHKRTVQRLFVRLKAEQSAESDLPLGRPPKLTSTLRRQLAQFKSKHPFKSSAFYARYIERKTGNSISIRSVRRALHQLGYTYRAVKRRSLTFSHRAERVKFAKRHLTDAWDRRMSGDEATFNLYRTGNRSWIRVSRSTGEDEPSRPVLSRRLEKISVSVVAVIGKGKKSALGFLPKGWNGADLVGIFRGVIFPSLQWRSSLHNPNELMWDNDGRHHQHQWKAYAAKKLLRPLDPWPSNSPDLNPIENVWSWLKTQVESKQPTTEQALKEAIQKAWDDFPIAFTDSLMGSMPRRLAACLRAKGCRIRY